MLNPPEGAVRPSQWKTSTLTSVIRVGIYSLTDEKVILSNFSIPIIANTILVVLLLKFKDIWKFEFFFPTILALSVFFAPFWMDF